MNRTNKRTRSGCVSCRSRHIKCDEAKPICVRCSEKNFQCNYRIKLQFKEDLESQNKVFGRQGVWSKNKRNRPVSYDVNQTYYLTVNNTDNLRFLNYFFEDFENYPILPSIRFSNLTSREMATGFSGYKDLGYAVSYYIDKISPVLNPIKFNTISMLTDKEYQGQIQIRQGLDYRTLLQYAKNHNHVMCLILCLSSTYLSRFIGITLEQRTQWKQQAMELRRMGLKILCGSLKQKDHYRVDFMVCLFLITMCDLADGCNDNWSRQLTICKRILGVLPKDLRLNDMELSFHTYIMEFFAYQESMGRTACNKGNVFNENLWTIDESIVLIPWMGCDKRLIGIISDITDLASRRNLENDEMFRTKTSQIMQQLQGIRVQKFDPDDHLLDISIVGLEGTNLVYIDTSSQIEEFCFLLTCETKRMSGLLYAITSLLNTTPRDPSVSILVNKIYSYTKFIIIENNLKWTSLTWPLYMASCSLNLDDPNSEQQMVMILEMFDLLATQSLGNVEKVKSNVETIWKRKSLTNDSFTNNNFWETIVINPTCNVSLG